MSVTHTSKIVTTWKTANFAQMSENHNWVTTVKCISTTERVINSMIIFKGKKILQNWIPIDNNLHQTTSFWSLAVSLNVFTDDDLNLHWLQQVFEPATWHTTQEGTVVTRLLILNSHHSHLFAGFQKACEDLEIMTVFLSSHTSHVTQPLDVDCFESIKQYYEQALDQKAYLWKEHIIKKYFLEIYAEVWTCMFLKQIIKEGFCGAELVSFNSGAVTDK